MTQIINHCDGNKVDTDKKPIELVKSLFSIQPAEFRQTEKKASNYNYVELICYNYCDEMDLIFCYNDKDNRSGGVLYFGHWNDGVV